MYFLVTYITVQSYPSFDLVQSPQVLFHLHVFPGYYISPITFVQSPQVLFIYMYFLVTCITVQSYPSLIWSNHHKCCSIYMYFLATCITVQSYLSLDLVQSPQVLFHLHVFPGHMYYSSVLS